LLKVIIFIFNNLEKVPVRRTSAYRPVLYRHVPLQKSTVHNTSYVVSDLLASGSGSSRTTNKESCCFASSIFRKKYLPVVAPFNHGSRLKRKKLFVLFLFFTAQIICS